MIPGEQDLATGSVAAAFRNTLGKIGAEKAQRVLNVLLESPFFYREDDVDLFGLLRRRQALFQEFFEVFFGWELYVDQQVARLIKPKTFNQQLKPGQRHVFRITGRHQYVLFILLLEFYQHQADEQNIDLEREPEVRFVLADFVEFAFKRYREELGSGMLEEAFILGEMRSLFKKLEHYRFIALAETTGVVLDEGLSVGFTREGALSVLYGMLPGLRCYRPEELNGLELLGRPRADDNGNGHVESGDLAEKLLEPEADEEESADVEEVES
jgi:hypothetical protein